MCAARVTARPATLKTRHSTSYLGAEVHGELQQDGGDARICFFVGQRLIHRGEGEPDSDTLQVFAYAFAFIDIDKLNGRQIRGFGYFPLNIAPFELIFYDHRQIPPGVRERRHGFYLGQPGPELRLISRDKRRDRQFEITNLIILEIAIPRSHRIYQTQTAGPRISQPHFKGRARMEIGRRGLRMLEPEAAITGEHGAHDAF